MAPSTHAEYPPAMRTRARGTIGPMPGKDGLYLRWRGIGRDGRWTRRKKKAKSDDPAKAEAELAKILEQEDAGAVAGVPTFARWMSDTYLPIYREEVRPATYARSLPQLARAVKRFGAMLLDEITATDVRAYVADLRKRRKLSTGTIRREVAVLRPVFEAAIERGHVVVNPVRVRVESAPPRRPDFISRQRLDAVLELTPVRYRAFLELLIDAGLRRTTAVELRWSDVAPDLSALLPNRGTSSKRKIPAVPLTANVRRSLRAIRAAQPKREVRVFPHLSANSVRLWWMRFRKRKDAPRWLRRWRFHDFRHRFGSALAQRGVPLPTVADLLGHANARLAAEVYATSAPSGAALDAIRLLEDSECPRRPPKRGRRPGGSRPVARRSGPGSRRS